MSDTYVMPDPKAVQDWRTGASLGAAQPPPFLNKFAGQMEGVQEADKAAFDQRNAAMLKPMSALSSINATPPPATPQQQPLPKAPNAAEYQKGAMEFASAMAVLGAIAGRFTRTPGSASLNAFAGALKGWQTGNLQAYESASKEWEQNTKATIENNRQVLEKYRLALENRKMNIDEQMSQIQLISTQYHDKIMYDAAAAKNYTMVAQIYEKNAEFTQKVAASFAALKAKDEKDQQKREESAAYWLSPHGQQQFATLPPEQQASVKQLIDIYANKQGGGAIDPDMVEKLARQDLAGDQSWKTNVGRGAQGGAMLRAVAQRKAEIMGEENISPEDVARRNQEFKAKQAGLSREESAVGQRAGGIAIAVQESKQTIPNVLAAAEKSAGKGLATWNKIENKWKVEKGDADFAYYVQQMNSLINLYGRVISGGGKGTVSDLEHAREMINPNMPLSAVKGALRGFSTEIDIAEKAPEKVRTRMRGQGGSEGGQTEQSDPLGIR